MTLEVSYLGSITRTLFFHLNEYKHDGANNTLCKSLQSHSNRELITVASVRIRHAGADGWGVKVLSIETHPGSGNFQPYSLSAKQTKFWTDGDDSCQDETFECCANMDWCSLQEVQGPKKGNNKMATANVFK